MIPETGRLINEFAIVIHTNTLTVTKRRMQWLDGTRRVIHMLPYNVVWWNTPCCSKIYNIEIFEFHENWCMITSHNMGVVPQISNELTHNVRTYNRRMYSKHHIKMHSIKKGNNSSLEKPSVSANWAMWGVMQSRKPNKNTGQNSS